MREQALHERGRVGDVICCAIGGEEEGGYVCICGVGGAGGPELEEVEEGQRGDEEGAPPDGVVVVKQVDGQGQGYAERKAKEEGAEGDTR